MDLDKKRKLFYGWRVLIAMWLIYFLSFSMIYYGMSILTTHMVRETHLTEALIGWTASAFFAGQMIFGIPAGVLNQKKGGRFCLITGAMLLCIGCVIIRIFMLPPIFYLAVVVLLGAGCLLAGIQTGPSLINEWFDQNKDLPMALFMAAGSCGGFIMPVLSERLANRIGWQGCWGIYAISVVCAGMLAIFFIKDTPAEVGEVRDGVRWRQARGLPLKDVATEELAEHTKKKLAMEPKKQSLGKMLRENRRLLAFSAIIFGVRLIFSSYNGYLVFFATENGLSSVMAAAVYSVYNIFGMAGRLAAGIHHRIPVNRMNCLLYLGTAAGGFLLAFSHSAPVFFLSAIVMGLFYNYSYPYMAVQISLYFGNENYAECFSVINTVGGIGNTLGPLIVSVFAGMFGYRGVFCAISSITAFCALYALWLKPQRR